MFFICVDLFKMQSNTCESTCKAGQCVVKQNKAQQSRHREGWAEQRGLVLALALVAYCNSIVNLVVLHAGILNEYMDNLLVCASAY